jgi:hypothetical protein
MQTISITHQLDRARAVSATQGREAECPLALRLALDAPGDGEEPRGVPALLLGPAGAGTGAWSRLRA